MKYTFEVTQTIYKYVGIEAENESDALNKANQMLEEGEIRFDDEKYLKMECNLTPISQSS